MSLGLGAAMAAVSPAEEPRPAPAKAGAKAEKADGGAEKGIAAAEASEFLEFAKTGAMAHVKFPHKAHAEKLKGCAACHEGKAPLFAREFDGAKGLKMADIYKGGACGACHDGKKEVDGKKVFAAKMACMKCHKKDVK
jgi:c(7)-type cytochrome triheme protein